MSLEKFRILREISSLYSMIIKSKDEQEEQRKRITRIESILKNNEEELNQFQEELEQKGKELNQTENDLQAEQSHYSQMMKNESNLTTQKQLDEFNKQKEVVEQKTSQLEDNAFNFMEEIEATEKSIQESKEFISGAKESLKEISNEANKEINMLEEKNKTYQMRIDSLLNEVPEDFKNKISKLIKKNKGNPLSFLKQGSCEFCRFKLNPSDTDKLEVNYGLVTCQGCERVLLPIELATS